MRIRDLAVTGGVALMFAACSIAGTPDLPDEEEGLTSDEVPANQLKSGGSGAADNGRRRCSNRTLSGDYGGTAQGVLLGVPGLPPEAQFRSVVATHFDGEGNQTRVEHTVVNGMLLNVGWLPSTGTYTVNSDCTGTMVVNTPNSPVPLSLAFVVVRHGSEILVVNDTNALSVTYIKID
jgi:hypothetical protein